MLLGKLTAKLYVEHWSVFQRTMINFVILVSIDLWFGNHLFWGNTDRFLELRMKKKRKNYKFLQFRVNSR